MKREYYNEVVAVDRYGSVLVLKSVFDDGKVFKGATGSDVIPMSEEQHDYMVSRDNIIEYFQVAWRQDAGSANGTELGLEDWVDENYYRLEEGVYERFDEEILHAAGIECYAAEIKGCGRIFREGWDTAPGIKIIRPDLQKLINDAEGYNND